MTQARRKLLFVVGAGGPPLEYALPRMARKADVHALAALPLNGLSDTLVRRWCTAVTDWRREGDGSLADRIVSEVRRIGADGVITFSEFTVKAVADACERLGLPGPGPNAAYARDKWLMRTRWSQEGLPVPAFRKVSCFPDLEVAARTLRMPFLLKPAGRGGGIGHQIVDSGTDLSVAWGSQQDALAAAAEHGIVEYSDDLDVSHAVAEEIIESTTQSWYDRPGYGDFLSVEGIVAWGEYHPLCITARFPPIPPFAEVGALSPTALSEDSQRRIEGLARAAVDCLGLMTCGTHTEIKLMADGQMCLLETAARIGGSTALSLAEHVFDVDLIGLLSAEAVGERQQYPPRMLVDGHGAAASIYLFGADATGRPWASEPEFHWRTLDWSRLISPSSRVEIMPSQMVPDGTPMSRYRAGSGALNYAGGVVLTSPDPATLLDDSYRLINGLEAETVRAAGGLSGGVGR